MESSQTDKVSTIHICHNPLTCVTKSKLSESPSKNLLLSWMKNEPTDQDCPMRRKGSCAKTEDDWGDMLD